MVQQRRTTNPQHLIHCYNYCRGRGWIQLPVLLLLTLTIIASMIVCGNCFFLASSIRRTRKRVVFGGGRHDSSSLLIMSSSSSSSSNRWTQEEEVNEYGKVSTMFGFTTSKKVDLNTYNLPSIEDIAMEWTAVVMPQTALQEEGIYLSAKSKKTIYVDTVNVILERQVNNPSLGIELLELAGGRSDGLGITIVSGFVDDGIAQQHAKEWTAKKNNNNNNNNKNVVVNDNNDDVSSKRETDRIMEGDSIVSISVIRRKKKKTTMQQQQEEDEASKNVLEEKDERDVYSVSMECYGYDKTVDSILSLPPPLTVSERDVEGIEERVMLTLKRLRRKPKVNLTLQYPPSMKEKDIVLELFAGDNLRRSMLLRGVKLNDPLARRFDNGGSGDCGAEGTCATCAVSIIKGDHLLNPSKLVEQQIFVNEPRYRMACKAIVGYGMQEGELVIRVNPRQW